MKISPQQYRLDFLRAFGIDTNLPFSEAQKAFHKMYRQRITRFHPDKTKGPGNITTALNLIDGFVSDNKPPSQDIKDLHTLIMYYSQEQKHEPNKKHEPNGVNPLRGIDELIERTEDSARTLDLGNLARFYARVKNNISEQKREVLFDTAAKQAYTKAVEELSKTIKTKPYPAAMNTIANNFQSNYLIKLEAIFNRDTNFYLQSLLLNIMNIHSEEAGQDIKKDDYKSAYDLHLKPIREIPSLFKFPDSYFKKEMAKIKTVAINRLKERGKEIFYTNQSTFQLVTFYLGEIERLYNISQ